MRIIGNAGTAPRKVQAVASGALASGDTVVVNADGTVSVVSGVDGAVGSKAQYNPADTRYPTAVYDTGNSKVVFVYEDDQTPNARVGTVSGTSISFGSEVRFQATFPATAISTVYDPDTGKIVVAYVCRDEGRVVIGTVSGTGISFGTPVVFHGGCMTQQIIKLLLLITMLPLLVVKPLWELCRVQVSASVVPLSFLMAQV